MNVEFPENWCLREWWVLESDLRDHREGMEETGWEKRSEGMHVLPATASQREIFEAAAIFAFTCFWLLRSSYRRGLAREGAWPWAKCLSPSQTSVESFYSWMSLAVLSKVMGVNPFIHIGLSITYRSYCHWTEAKKEEITPEVQQRNQGNLRGWQNRRWRIFVGYWILCLSTPDTNKYFLKEIIHL